MLDIKFIVFLKNCYGELQLIICNYSCRQKVPHRSTLLRMCKNDDGPSHKNIRFFIATKGIGLSLNTLRSRKALKSFIAEFELITSINDFITTVAYRRIFLKNI